MAAKGWAIAAGVALLGVVAGTLAAGTLAGSSGPHRRAGPSAGAVPTTRPSAPAPAVSTTSPARPLTAVGTYQVASTSLSLSEPTASGASRSLPTTVWFPASSGAGGLVADRGQAPYPLLVFSQGYDISVSAFLTLIEDWASAGFVVAAPTYPHTDPGDPALDENDIVNHPADLRFVISSLLALDQQPNSTLSGLLDPDEVGLTGHSDGGDVTLAVADNSCCQDSRVKAAAVLSGAELAAFGGSYFGASQVPLLVVQGTDDTINPPGCSVATYNGAATPKYYLDLLGAGHAPPYVDSGADQDVIARVTTDFFDAELAGETAGIGAMVSDGDTAGVAELSDASAAPLAPSSCPGAPG